MAFETLLYEHADGVAEGLSAGKTVIDMSSISPIETKAFAKKIADYITKKVADATVDDLGQAGKRDRLAVVLFFAVEHQHLPSISQRRQHR